MEDAVIEHIDGVPIIRIRKALWGNPRSPAKEKRPIWTSDEITKMLKIIKEKNILSLLYGGKYRRSDVFKVVAANLKKMGYIRTSEQISTKWKQLRLTYAHAKAETKSGNLIAKQECAYYIQMDDLLGDKLHIVGVDTPEESVESKQDIEKNGIQNRENMEPVIGDEVQLEISETEYSQVDFSQVEVIQTDASENDVSLPGPSGQEGTVLIEVQEPQQDQLEFSHGIDSETTVVETSPPKKTRKRRMCPSGQEGTVLIEVQEPQQDQLEFSHGIDSETTVVETSPPKKTRKRRMFRNPPGRLRKSNEGTYSNALKSFTKEWELMMMRVAEKERDEDRLEREREKTEQRKWEERLIESQSEAMTKANSEFLTGLKGLFDELKK